MGYRDIDNHIDLIEGNDAVWEHGPMEILTQENQMSVFDHDRFWQPINTLRDKNYLENFWKTKKSLWKK